MGFANEFNSFSLNTQKSQMLLGIDPGLCHTGWALVKSDQPDRIIAHGCVSPPRSLPLEKRLSFLYDNLENTCSMHHPQTVVLEKTFVSVNKQDSLSLAYARGIGLLLAGRFDIPVVHYAANTLKKSVTGYGHANKTQMTSMVSRHFHLEDPLSSHETDALACIITHLAHTGEI